MTESTTTTTASSTAAAQGRSEAGKALRGTVRRSAHATFEPAADRADPVSILTDQDAARLPWLVPVRHGRMAESSFSFYRGAAAIMAGDLAGTPTTGLNTQLCGDAHLANFGTYASAERRQVFDVNDFDETLPGPWEWDVKRMATSFVLAARDNRFPDATGTIIAVRAVAAYREAMARMSALPALQVWYAQVALADIMRALPSKAERKSVEASAKKARGRTSQRALGTLTEMVGGKLQIRSDPPLLEPLRDLAGQVQADADRLKEAVHTSFASYLASLPDDRAHLLRRFELLDIALKVVGVGSVGTRCFIVLLQGRDNGEPLILQVKEATASVLEKHLPASAYSHHGERVVQGQRLMQASSDIFLGWSEASTSTDTYYWRQFHDMKGSANVAAMSPDQLTSYAALCGATLAHAHARAGDAVTISGYLGSTDVFDRAVGEFAVAYARQNDADYAAFTQAIRDGRIQAEAPPEQPAAKK